MNSTVEVIDRKDNLNIRFVRRVTTTDGERVTRADVSAKSFEQDGEKAVQKAIEFNKKVLARTNA